MDSALNLLIKNYKDYENQEAENLRELYESVRTHIEHRYVLNQSLCLVF